MKITTAARRIARAHNDRIKKGFAGNGFLVFDCEGKGAAWYSDGSLPSLREGCVKINMRWRKISGAEVQEILDHE